MVRVVGRRKVKLEAWSKKRSMVFPLLGGARDGF
jgi:hypothetical protein